METAQRVCANCRVLVQPAAGRGAGWEHVPEFAAKFTRAVCADPAPGREASGSEAKFGLARMKGASSDKLSLRGQIEALAQPAHTPVTVAVDGSYKLFIGEKVIKPMSWAYLATDGVYGLGTSLVPGSIVGGRPIQDGSGRDPERALQAELRAIANALQVLGTQRPVTVLTDSRDARDYMLLWRAGHLVMPGGYDNSLRSSGRESTFARLARRAHEAGARLDVRWVPSHSGHPLNEGADALAKMARAWATGRLNKSVVAADARRAVLGSLTRHADTVAA